MEPSFGAVCRDTVGGVGAGVGRMSTKSWSGWCRWIGTETGRLCSTIGTVWVGLGTGEGQTVVVLEGVTLMDLLGGTSNVGDCWTWVRAATTGKEVEQSGLRMGRDAMPGNGGGVGLTRGKDNVGDANERAKAKDIEMESYEGIIG